MHTHTKHWQRLHVWALGIVCIAASLTMGIYSAGDVRTIASLEAGMPLGDGDMTGDGKTDREDVIEILEIVRGYREITAQDLRADPNGDGQITVDDALQLLKNQANL